MVDYIIIGAGSAGCVLANRLSADPTVQVLLLEAGDRDKKQEIHIPAAMSKLFKTPFDWEYYTEPQPHLNDRKLYWPRGKTLGGTSSINAMIYIRGNQLDYDGWAELGNEGWGYDEVLPYFKKAQHQERGPSAFHGVGGPLNVADLRSPNPLSQMFVEACASAGLPLNPDFNGDFQDGMGFYQVTQKKGKRHSTAVAYLNPVLRRPNLKVEIKAHVNHIIFEGQQAVGVSYQQNGQPVEVRAEREVILCGGTINSPQLLLLSGIGPADDLRALNLPVVMDLPGVGRNLQDHLAVPVVYESKAPVSLAAAESLGSIAKYMLLKKGHLTSNVGEAGGFIRTQSDLPAPDIQYHFAPAYYLDHGFTMPPGHGFTLGPTLLIHSEPGWLSLRTTNPSDAPAIQANYLADSADMEALVMGVKLAQEIAHSQPLADIRGPEVRPTAKLNSDEEIKVHIRETAFTLYHPAGTCKMGNDPQAVVNDRLQVHGVAGLRVIDASIMPVVVRGNTNAPTIMIAEKGADLVLGR